jgi:hypothetical protein
MKRGFPTTLDSMNDQSGTSGSIPGCKYFGMRRHVAFSRTDIPASIIINTEVIQQPIMIR